MSTTISLEEAQASLKELIGRLAPGEEIIITENQKPVARLVGERPPRPAPGLGKGSILYMAPDFDAPLEEFEHNDRPARKAGSAKGLLTIVSDDDEHLKDFAEYVG